MESGSSPRRHQHQDQHYQHQHQHPYQSQHHCPTHRITGPPLDLLDQKFASQPLSQRSPWDSYFEKSWFRASESPEGPKPQVVSKQNKTVGQILQFWGVLKNLFLVHSGELLGAPGIARRTVAHQALKAGRAQNHLETQEGFKVTI